MEESTVEKFSSSVHPKGLCNGSMDGLKVVAGSDACCSNSSANGRVRFLEKTNFSLLISIVYGLCLSDA